MELAARPLITAGVALVGAGVVIVTPVKAAVPDIEVAAVQLTFSPEGIDPITAPSPRQTRSRRYSTCSTVLPTSPTQPSTENSSTELRRRSSSIEPDQAIATALGFSFPTPAKDTVSPLDDLLSTLTTALDGDLPTALTGLSADFSALLTDSLGNLTSLF